MTYWCAYGITAVANKKKYQEKYFPNVRDLNWPLCPISNNNDKTDGQYMYTMYASRYEYVCAFILHTYTYAYIYILHKYVCTGIYLILTTTTHSKYCYPHFTDEILITEPMSR